MIYIIDAIKSLNSDAKVTVEETGNVDTAEILWLDGTPEISKADIKVEMDKLRADYDAQDYARKRKDEYPPFGDQLDMQYHDKINGTTTWQDTIKAVKDNHPKGG